MQRRLSVRFIIESIEELGLPEKAVDRHEKVKVSAVIFQW